MIDMKAENSADTTIPVRTSVSVAPPDCRVRKELVKKDAATAARPKQNAET